MALELDTGGSSTEEVIDVTPMISVLLVLIIFFIVAQQGLQKGLNTQVPPVQKKKVTQPSQANNNQITLQVQPGPTYLLNKHPIPVGQLQQQLHKVFEPRIRKVLFIKGSGKVAYGLVAHAVDMARAAGVEVVGLVPRTNNKADNSNGSG
jgi:biopolymer transport protein ExbD